jgi:hypothetical protein
MPATAETMKTAGPKERQSSHQNQQQQQRQQEHDVQQHHQGRYSNNRMLAAVGTPATVAGTPATTGLQATFSNLEASNVVFLQKKTN